eukprot:4303385-Amphidinium_carterae.2
MLRTTQAIDTLYDVRVRASCSDPNADSGYLTRLEAVQTLGEVARAGEPTGGCHEPCLPNRVLHRL